MKSFASSYLADATIQSVLQYITFITGTIIAQWHKGYSLLLAWLKTGGQSLAGMHGPVSARW